MTLPEPPVRYSRENEAQRNRTLVEADSRNLKRQSDIQMVSGARLILISPDGSRWSVTVSDAGTLAAVIL